MSSKKSKRPVPSTAIVPEVVVTQSILLLRGHRVMLDADLARLYAVENRALVQAVKRNLARFPEDFMFQLSWDETLALKSQSVILNGVDSGNGSPSRSQSVTLKRGDNIKYRPYAFTEQGVAMLSSVLRSPRAVQVNIEIMRTFVRLRTMLASNTELRTQLAALERKYDHQFKVVFDAIRELLKAPAKPLRRIGF